MLDVNAGIPLADEPAMLARAIQLVQAVTDVPLSIDSSIVEALEAGSRRLPGQAARQLGDRRGRGDGAGAPARRQATAPPSSRSPTTRPASRGPRRALRGREADRRAGRRPRHPRQRRRRRSARDADRRDGDGRPAGVPPDPPAPHELKVNTTCGASNVSFGLPNRHVVTGTFLSMAISAGMTSAIMNPLHAEVKAAVMAADVLAGNDPTAAAGSGPTASRPRRAVAVAGGAARRRPPR